MGVFCVVSPHVEDIFCWTCHTEIVQYYHDGYKGKRGKCPICKVDFPLE